MKRIGKKKAPASPPKRGQNAMAPGRAITGRQRTEEALQESEKQYRRLFENSLLAISQASPDGKLAWVNMAYASMYGYASPEQMIAEVTDIEQQLYADSKDRREVLRILSEKGVMGPKEITVVRRDGTRFTVEVLAQEFRDAAGRLLGYQASHVEITERKRAEEALRESEERLRMAADAAGFGTYVYDFVSGASHWSPELKAILGVPADQPLPLDADLVFPRLHPEDRSAFLAAMTAANDPRGDGIFRHEYRVIHPDGAVRWLQVRGRTSFAGEGKARHAMRAAGVVLDITARTQAEEALRESERLYHLLFNACPDGIVLVGSDGRIKSANLALSRMHRYDSPEELLGLPLNLLVAPAMREYGREIMERRLRGEEVPLVEYRLMRKDGTEFWGEISSAILRNPSGAVTGYICIAHDTTDRKRAEETLLASREQLRALAARIEHIREEERTGIARELHDELGQGLTALQIDLAWLDGHLRTAGPADLSILRDKIADMVPRTERLIETTQAISSAMRPGMLDDLGLVAAIEWLAADFGERAGLACVANLPVADIAVDLACSVALFRIVQEALTNVVRHARASGVEIRLRATEGELMLEVEDNGCGISRQQVANPHSLGLFSMRERAAALGGTVDFRSNTGRGTTVSVRMPLARS
jgi:PAS domain S-box-containing protein